MRILHLNTHEISGGAAIAARRLHLGLSAEGVDSCLAVGVKESDTPNAILADSVFSKVARLLCDRLERKTASFLYTRPKHPAHCTFSLLPSFRHRRVNKIARDILHLHWVTDGFLAPFSLGRLQGPTIWTMHDTWPFTGGCHFFQQCEGHTQSCGRCPELGSTCAQDLSRWHWKLKHNALQRLRPVMVSPSREYAVKAARSGMLHGLRVETIPNGIDTSVFRPIPQTLARQLLQLPKGVPLILFGAVGATTDHNKGFDLLLKALRALKPEQTNCLIFGASHDGKNNSLPCPAFFLGQLRDNISLALTYSAADVFVCPSRCENLPNTILESLACGTPVVAFSVGGIPDMVEHGLNGYLARPYDTEDLARGIAMLLDDTELRQRMGEAGRKKIDREFSMPVVARQYIALYEDILATQNTKKYA